MKIPWYVFSSSSCQPHSGGTREDPLSLPSSDPAPRLFASLGFPPGSWIFFPPLCGVHQKLIDTSAQHKVLLFKMSHSLSLRNGITSGNSLFKNHYYLTDSCLCPLIWYEEQKLSQTRAGQWPLMRQGHRAWKICQEETSILCSNQSGPIRPSREAGFQESFTASSSNWISWCHSK